MARKQSEVAAEARQAIADIPRELARLREMTVGQLRERYREVFGEPTRSRNKDYLRKKIAWRVQELAEGGLSERALARIDALAPTAPVRRRSSGNGAMPAEPVAAAEPVATARDPRLPEPGTVLTREHNGVEHRVVVLDDGFEYRGERFPTLSKVARAITGTNWNGYLFFSLQRRVTEGRRGGEPVSRRANGAARVVPETKRCAVYTRKSTDEGLDQEFNSLDAQRESGEAFIASQRHQGWECLPDRYDDGGFTGANIERPALRRLLADIEEGKVDAVVVYKVDRLSRSLLDFARLMEVFERRQVSFVSVTQQFNTATSMGRLVLNVLLSFAQFEREMIAERTRDKIAAARRKGKWTGGPVPLGYDVVDKKLVVNELEAVVVRELFSLYEQHRSALATARLLNEAGRTTKHHRANNGNVRAGKPWSKDAVLRVLKNAVYAGLMPGAGELHEAEHQPLVERARFLRVQAMLDARNGEKRDHGRNPAYLLRGILRCARCGGAMTPASTRKARKEHRYYRCVTRDKQGRKACTSRPLSADAIEAFVVARIREVAADGTLAADVERRLRARIETRRDALVTERRDLPPKIAKLAAEGRRLVEKISEANGAAASLLDQRIAEVGDQLGRAERRLAQVERAAAALDHAEIETRWVVDALVDFDAIWDVLSTDNRARLVRALVRSVAVDEPSGNVTALLTDLEFDDLGVEGDASDRADTHQVGGGRAAPSMEARP